MICYKDMTFCDAPCSNEDCFRRLNQDIVDAAHRWWANISDTVPICIQDFSGHCADFIREGKCDDSNKAE